jgi:hypothetical protein
MNETNTTTTEERLEPFATLLELIEEYGEDEVLEAIAEYAKLRSEEEET